MGMPLARAWGEQLAHSWFSKPLKEMKLATFNARVETVAEKPMFRGEADHAGSFRKGSGETSWAWLCNC
jgi:hypothetical protein